MLMEGATSEIRRSVTAPIRMRAEAYAEDVSRGERLSRRFDGRQLDVS